MPVLVAVTLASASGLVEDNVVNNWVVDEGVVDPVLNYPTILGPFATFYENIGGYISQAISRNADACSAKLYVIDGHLDGSPHGSGSLPETFTLPAAGSLTDFPSEVAACLTLHGYLSADAPPVEAPDGGDPGSAIDRPRQRKTGRIYLGPLNQNASAEDANNQPRPSASFRNAVLTHVQTLQDDLLTVATAGLHIWSRVNAQTSQAREASMDDAFDTQRRRGVARTTRTTVVLA